MSPALVLPISGWIMSPSVISSAALVTYSWARWIGLRVWKATIRFQPRSSNAFLDSAGLSSARVKASSWSGSSSTSIGPGDAARALLVDRGDARDAPCRSFRRRSRPPLEVALEDLVDVEPAERLAFVARELDRVALRDVEVGGQGDRDRPVLAAGQRHVLDDALPVLGALGAGEGREAAVADHLEVGGLAIGELQLEGSLCHGITREEVEQWIEVGQEAARYGSATSTRAARTRSCRGRPSGRRARPRRRPGFRVQWVQPIEG